MSLAFENEGADRVDIARLLWRADPVETSAGLVAMLEASDDAKQRRIALEMLTEMRPAEIRNSTFSAAAGT